MPEFEQSLRMEAPPDSVLAFVSDVRNLPAYVPTTKDAQSQGPDRVRLVRRRVERPVDNGRRRKDERRRLHVQDLTAPSPSTAGAPAAPAGSLGKG